MRAYKATNNGEITAMGTGKMLIPLSAATVKKVTIYHSLFGLDSFITGTN
jgi:hypothetical protein